MTREIKFRVWSKTERRWVTNQIVVDCRGIPLIHFLEITDLNKQINHIYLSDNYEPVIQRFTGLKDKNGKEIYEGDILRYLISNRLIKVIFINGGFACQGGYPLFGYVENDVEIVGNIFENPDLLK